MLLKDKQTDILVEILDIQALFMPTKNSVPGQIQSGQEEQDPADFKKDSLKFPSGENLPRCWVDANYQNDSGNS